MLDYPTTAPALLPVGAPERAETVMGDGTVLVSDIHRPVRGGTYPVLVMRQPYGRAIASTIVLAHPAWYASHGYVVVVQDVRGTGGSGGDFDPFQTEISDGAETLVWARALPRGNGAMATYGFSYQGMTQLLALAGGARPDAMAISMAAFDPEFDWATEGGVFRVGLCTGWAAQMARDRARRQGDDTALAALAPEQGWQSQFTYLVSRPDLSHLARWCTPGGAGHDPAAALCDTALNVPLLQVAGTADFLLRGSLAADHAFRAQSPRTTHLILAPWPHIPWAQTDTGLSIDRAQIAFFDHYLKDIGPRPAACIAHVSGAGCWATYDPTRLHDTPTRTYHLASGGLAAPTVSDGQLCETAPGDGCDILVHDPSRPGPLIGGAAGQPPGPAERGALDTRSDVACYTTAPFPQAGLLFGPAHLTLALEQTGPTVPVAASLSCLRPDGSAHVLSTAVAAPGHTLRFDALAARIAAGDALRLSIQPAPTPDYLLVRAPVLPGAHTMPTRLTLHHGESLLLLPLTPEAPDD